MAPTTLSPTRPPPDVRPNVATDETPAQLPIFSVTGTSSAERRSGDEEETPALDSLDSTPRGMEANEAPETPFHIDPLQAGGANVAQDAAEATGSGATN